MEFSSVIWNPYFKIDITVIEKVQRRFTKAIFPKLTYPVRLSRLGLQTLEMRRTLADLTTCYKLMSSLIDIDCTDFFTMSTVTHTRGNSRKLLKHNIVNFRDANTFHNRVINTWNKLPESIVLALSISCFKRRYLHLCVMLLMIIFSLISFFYFFIFLFTCVLFACIIVLCLSGF